MRYAEIRTDYVEDNRYAYVDTWEACQEEGHSVAKVDLTNGEVIWTDTNPYVLSNPQVALAIAEIIQQYHVDIYSGMEKTEPVIEYTVTVELLYEYEDKSGYYTDETIDVRAFSSYEEAVACADAVNIEDYGIDTDEYDGVEITIIERDDEDCLLPEQNQYCRTIK